MKILADENITGLAELFAGHGEITTAAGRAITADLVRDVDVLLVRSVTKVNAQLLAGSRCRFVGTATSGTDHIDIAWLRARGIAFADAHGCNAAAVADYVLAALAALGLEDGEDWRRRSVGIIGCGAVGSRLAARFRALGMDLCIYDPFLDAGHPLAAHFHGLESVLEQDIVTLHVPLTRDGPWPTWQLLDAAALAKLRHGAILVNAARGGVIDEAALKARLDGGPELRVVLDTWVGEPAIDASLFAQVRFGTAHIAGYSAYGKWLGTAMVHEAFCRHFGIKPRASAGGGEERPVLDCSGEGGEGERFNRCLLRAYDIRADHARLATALAGAEAARDFDRLRREYPVRTEFAEWALPGDLPAGLAAALRAAGVGGAQGA